MQRNDMGALPQSAANLTLNDIIQPSSLSDQNIKQQTKNILDAFNADVNEDVTVESVWFGKRIDQNEFRLVHRNNVPQLVSYSYYPRRLGIYLTGKTNEIGVFKQTDLLIGAHGSYLVNVPQGKIAQAWLGTNQAVFLGPGPHVIKHPNFKLDETPLVDIAEAYISHGNYKILRIPRGQVAKIWLGSTPYLLESQPEPYVFDDPSFRLVTNAENGNKKYFTDASERLIQHGSIKRVLPHTGEVAITYDSGQLKIVKADGKPFAVNSDTFVVDGFLQTAAQTLVFPSERTKQQRKRDNGNRDHINYEEFRTNDGLPIGVNLLVVYEIFDPKTTLERLKKDDIINHIENIVVADMGRVIQSCTSSDFQKTDQTVIKGSNNNSKEKEKENNEVNEKGKEKEKKSTSIANSNTTFYSHLQDIVKNQLADDLKDWGIHLVRLNIETPKILDHTIADEMAKNSLLTAKARAEASTLGLDYTIKQQRATQEAEKQRIEKERARANKIIDAEGDAKSKTMLAQADFDTTQIKANAEKIVYENDIRKTQLQNETAINKIKLEVEIEKQRQQNELAYLKEKAQLFNNNPQFLELEKTRVCTEAMKGIKTSVLSPEVAQAWYGSRIGFFPSLPAAMIENGNVTNDTSCNDTNVMNQGK